MSRKKEVLNKTRNNNFAAAIDWLKRNRELKSQKKLAEEMGVNKDTITNIIRYRTEVTDDVITKLQKATGCVFNLQWLRGESSVMLADNLSQDQPQGLNMSSAVNAMLATRDELIAELRDRIADKDEIISLMKSKISLLEQQIVGLQLEKGVSTGLHTIGAADGDSVQPGL